MMFKKTKRPARKLLSKFCASLVARLKKSIFSPEFSARHKEDSRHFTRERKLPFPTMTLILMNMLKGSLQDELDHFFKAVNGAAVGLREVTKGAFCRARKRFRHTAFVELNRELVAHRNETAGCKRWNGLRLLAVDGSTMRVPDNAETRGHFGLVHSATADAMPMARVSCLFDLLNNLSVDAEIGPHAVGEREMAGAHLAHAGPGDLMLCDRGYPARHLFAMIRNAGADFCARMPLDTWEAVRRFAKSGMAERVVRVKPGGVHQARHQAVKLRLVRVELENGTTEILATSLMNRERYPAAVFGALYHLRWGIEENYKRWKRRLEIENWSGKSVESVLQDFHAKALAMNIAAAMAAQADDIVQEISSHKIHSYKTNITQALSRMKGAAVWLFLKTDPLAMLRDMIDMLVKTVEPIRTGRQFPRKHRNGGKLFHPGYKPCR
jgi:hypothetical protein